MKAVIIPRPGGPENLRLEDRPVPVPGPGQLRIRVYASALNRADLLQRRGVYPAPPGYPSDIPGLEYTGEVDTVGAGVTRFVTGDRVMGLVGGGAHAEFVLAEEGELIPVPRDMDWMEAAAIPEAFMTAFDALLPLAGLREGERVLIHAVASGVGTAAVQLASASGAITLGSSRTPAKLTDVLPLGLDHPINSSREDWPERVREICEPDKVNVILDLVGGSYHAANLRLAAPLGRIIVIGVMGGARAETDLALLLRERLRLIGTVMRSRPLDERTTLASAFTESVVPLFESGRIRPVTDRTFPFEQIGEAHRLLESNTTTGKIVLYW